VAGRAGEQYPACPVVWPSTRSRGALVVKPRWAIAKGPTLQVLTWRHSKCPELCVRRPQTFRTNPVEDVPFRGLCEDGRTFLLFFLSKQEGDLELFFFDKERATSGSAPLQTVSWGLDLYILYVRGLVRTDCRELFDNCHGRLAREMLEGCALSIFLVKLLVQR
jgi:hypothetical protein